MRERPYPGKGEKKSAIGPINPESRRDGIFGQVHLVDGRLLKKGGYRGLVQEVEFVAGAGDDVDVDVGAAFFLEPPDNSGTHHAEVAGNVYGLLSGAWHDIIWPFSCYGAVLLPYWRSQNVRIHFERLVESMTRLFSKLSSLCNVHTQHLIKV